MSDTFNPSLDGYLDYNGAQASFATYRGIATASSADTTDTGTTEEVYLSSGGASPNYSRIRRSILIFDTSALPDTAIISAAKLQLYITAADVDYAQNINLTTVTPASDTALATSDMNVSLYGSTKLATGLLISGLTLNAYNDLNFNASGIAIISLNGKTRLAVRLECDIDNAEPTWPGANKGAGITFNTVDNASNKPQLVVTYTLSSPSRLQRVEVLALQPHLVSVRVRQYLPQRHVHHQLLFPLRLVHRRLLVVVYLHQLLFPLRLVHRRLLVVVYLHQLLLLLLRLFQLASHLQPRFRLLRMIVSH
jgi:hypothetical protein